MRSVGAGVELGEVVIVGRGVADATGIMGVALMTIVGSGAATLATSAGGATVRSAVERSVGETGSVWSTVG